MKPSKDTKGWYFAPALRRARSVRHPSVLSGYEARNFGSVLPSSCGNSGHIHPPPAAARPGAADLKNTDDCRGLHPPATALRIDGRYPQSASHHSKCIVGRADQENRFRPGMVFQRISTSRGEIPPQIPLFRSTLASDRPALLRTGSILAVQICAHCGEV